MVASPGYEARHMVVRYIYEGMLLNECTKAAILKFCASNFTELKAFKLFILFVESLKL